MFIRLAMLVIALAVVCTPRSAEASRYFWKDVNGNWNAPGNWTLIDGPINDGFPNRPGDEAFFTLDYTANRTVTIPDGVTATLGVIYFSSRGITINAAGSGKLRMQHTVFSGAVINRIAGLASDTDTINAPIELRSDMTVTVGTAAMTMTFNGTISNNLGAFGVTKLGPGKMDLRTFCTYLGRTEVQRGTLHLWNAATPSIRGTLSVGPVGATTNDLVASVVVTSPNQIADDSPVEVKRGGVLEIDDQETVGPTTVTHGLISVVGPPNVPATLAMKGLSMTGGTVESYDGSQIILLGTVTATNGGSAEGARIRATSGNGVLVLGAVDRTFDITRGTANSADLVIEIPVAANGATSLIKQGNGQMIFARPNTYKGDTLVMQGELIASAINNTVTLNGRVQVGQGQVGQGASPARLILGVNSVLDTAPVAIGANGTVIAGSETPETVGLLTLTAGGRLVLGPEGSDTHIIASALTMIGGRVDMNGDSSLKINGVINLNSASTTAGTEPATIAGGRLVFGGARTISVENGPDNDADAVIAALIAGNATQGFTKSGPGTLALTANNTYGGAATVTAGRLNINGKQPASPVVVTGGILGGKGTTGPVTVQGTGSVSPGDRTGRLSTGPITYTAGTSHALYLEGSEEGQYGQLAVTGVVTLGNTRFGSGTKTNLSPSARYVVIANDGNDPIVGTFEGINEGDTVKIGGVPYTITYRGGDGNDVVFEGLTPLTYYLAEGATGEFFDDDVLIANPNERAAPVTLTFLREGGATVAVQRVIPAMSRVTIHVDELEGLADVSASVKVESIDRLPLVVERSMFWDASYYGGHTANAVSKPEKTWIFAEGFQGFFDTYILIANANAAATKATLTFLRENDTPVVKTVDVNAFTRKTIYTGDFDELKGRAFGIVVDATEPVIAERAMYFATQPGKLWSGGHVNTGIVAPSRSWFHAEGATGTFFSTFILLSNPQDTKANVTVKFLLSTGEVIAKSKTLEPKQRLTINPATEGDVRLENAAVSTVVESDVPIVSERSMYWEGDAKPLGEGHNSSGIAETGERWGLAEGRVGGPRNFDTYILLANPAAAKASVRITYVRESGAPIVKEYEVAATSRFNVDVKTVVPELQNSSFGAIIEVLNDVPIAVERSLYWDANGAFWAGGTNALATRLPPVK